MRDVTHRITSAFLEGRKLKAHNTATNGEFIALHNIAIIWRDRDTAVISFSLRGYATATTRERINGLLCMLGDPRSVWQHKSRQYFGTHDDYREIEGDEHIALHGPLASLAIEAERHAMSRAEAAGESQERRSEAVTI